MLIKAISPVKPWFTVNITARECCLAGINSLYKLLS